jgi:hypothetical protein
LSQIRPFARGDLAEVGALLRSELLGSRSVAGRPVEAFLAEALLDAPWADPELPSLVQEDDDGAVVGFLAVSARRMVLEGEPVKVAVLSHLTVAEAHRGGAAGAMLLRRALGGPQDLTISDTAIDVVSRAWRLFGGRVDSARSLEWIQVLRPGAVGTTLLRTRLTRHVRERRSRRADGHQGAPAETPIPGIPLHVAGRLLPRLRGADRPEVTRADLDPAEAAAALPTLSREFVLRPDYDEAYLRWTLGMMAAGEGRLVARRVEQRGRTIGWYVYRIESTGRARVVQVVADARAASAVVADLVDDARDRGASLISGRFEPHLREALVGRLAMTAFARRHVAHSRRADVLAALYGDRALLTLLDGEWW